MTIDPVIFEVLKLRVAANKITAGKLSNGIARLSPDSRLRDSHGYYKAHTGRFGGQGMQTQNLPRGIEGLDVAGLLNDLSCETVKAEAERHGANASDVLSSLIRPCFTATPGNVLLVSDYNAVELRGLAWIANEEKLLEQLRQNTPIYKEMAAVLYKKPVEDITDSERWVGKQIILGCGYSMSAAKFDLMTKGFGVDLAERGVTAEQCVEAYRDSYPKIAGVIAGEYNGKLYRRHGIWHLLGNAALACVEHGICSTVGRCRFVRDGRHMQIELPSGRPIVYRNARLEMLKCRVAGRPVGEERPTVIFNHPKGYNSVLFGGKIAENVVQGICRDLLCDALEKCENLGLPVVMHTHDEIVVDIPKDKADLRLLESTMETGPIWAEGFPIKVKGYTCERYVKK